MPKHLTRSAIEEIREEVKAGIGSGERNAALTTVKITAELRL